MTLVRLCIAALALGACAPQVTTAPRSTTPSTYRLCSDPQFEAMCTPASIEMPPAPRAEPIRVDTNLHAPAAKRTATLG